MTTRTAPAGGAVTPTLAGTLAAFVAELRWDTLPDAVVAPWLSDRGVRAFMPRVTVSGDPALPEGSEAHVTVETRAGRRFDRHVPFARGAPENPLSREEVIAKYEELAPRALTPHAVREVREAVFALESPGSLRRLLDALGRPR
jgi:2-methylcitrate dehydratase PrpD